MSVQMATGSGSGYQTNGVPTWGLPLKDLQKNKSAGSKKSGWSGVWGREGAQARRFILIVIKYYKNNPETKEKWKGKDIREGLSHCRIRCRDIGYKGACLHGIYIKTVIRYHSIVHVRWDGVARPFLL